MVSSFLSLPREIRDKIYYETLFANNVSRIGARAVKNLNTWFAGREHLPGYYRPLLHFHKAGEPRCPSSGLIFNWSHETRVASVPAIFQVGGMVAEEARELYLRSHMLLFEAKILDDADAALTRWSNCLRQNDLALIQRLHLYVHVSLVFNVPEDHSLAKKLREAGEFSLDLVDPVFRIELQNGGDDLAIVSIARFNSDFKAVVISSMKKIFGTRMRSNLAGSFTGEDLLLATRAMLDACGSCRKAAENIVGQLDIEDVACIYDYADKDDSDSRTYGKVVRLRDRWLNAVFKYSKQHNL
ncbi:uncharacterized protein PV09_02298 [Verruconis gallopava]|uniref:Uncharacterized protein n=1 Tax=Verruconis gallopava TaxID=253628 RepID=A0A0D2B5S9_9PEZI|nr:uncharacterized protein PV09_02298 [Verruconis gallopava]KIW06579.1 hypothetical protein PV09_02298 [Verruconis gallopava]